MKTRAELDPLFVALENDIPKLKRNMNTFFRRFEARVEQIQSEEMAEDTDYVFGRLVRMLESAGIDT